VPKAIRSRWFAAATVMAGLVVVVSGAAILGPWTTEPTNVEPTASPRATTAASQQPSPSPSPSAEPLPSLPPLGERPSLIATAAKGSVVKLGAGFLLSGTVDATAEELAQRVTVDPPIALTKTADPASGGVLLQPAAPLQPGVVYRFDLANAAGDPAESWAFQADMALHVVETLPYRRATDVPVTTGIEITFDQDGVKDAAEHFRIQPQATGRFERHARTLVFVPDKRLKAETVYTVTLTRGVTVEGTGQALEADVVFQFETRTRRTSSRSVAWLTRDLFDSSTTDRPLLGVEAFGRRQIYVEAYRFPDQAAAIAAYRHLVARPYWTAWSGTNVISTKGLRRVVSADLSILKLTNGARAVRLPARLPQGAYLVQTGHRDRPQAILQVTDVSTYAAMSATKTIVWVNELGPKRRGALPGAEVRLAGGSVLGTTVKNGLMTATTPAGLSGSAPSDGPPPILTIRAADGRTAFMPVAVSGVEARIYSDWGRGYESSPYWQLLETDRNLYRRTDQINLWAVVRNRADGAVPASATVRLTPDDPYDDWESGYASLPVASVDLKPNQNGVLSGSVPLVEAAEGYYRLSLLVGDMVVAERGLAVGAIEKPAYRVDVTTGHHVYLAGDRIKTTITAQFYEGTPVPALPLSVDGPNRERTVRTDASGVATFATTAVASTAYDLQQQVTVGAARAEEGSIGGYREFYVFPSSRWLDADGTVQAGRVRMTGRVRLVDFERLEREVDAEGSIWGLDYGGKPVAGAAVRMRFVELIPKRRQIGTAYDFIEKRVVPIYLYDYQRRSLGTTTVQTRADGSFSGSVRAPSTKHDYEVEVTTRDPEGRIARVETYASADRASDPENGSNLVSRNGNTYSLGDTIDLTMYGNDGKAAHGRDDRYLFFQAQQGIRSSVVQASPRYVTTFTAASVPNVSIYAVRFTGTGYETSGSTAWLRQADRELTVTLTPDAAAYRPGGNVNVGVRTLDRTGKPVPATVVLRAVDEKLYTIGAASASDPLGMLYQWVDSGVLAQYASHRSPANIEGGDTGGGDGDDYDRSDFRDVVLFKTVDTGADGRASVSFKLSDDLTSWRIAGSGFTAGLLAGEGEASIPVGLPMFIDASIAPDYLVADRPSIHVRAYGTALKPGDPVTFTVASATLPMAAVTVKAKAFEDVPVALPALSIGDQTLTIRASASADGRDVSDRLTRTFRVSASRLTQITSRYAELGDDPLPRGHDGVTTLVFSDAGRGRSLALLTSLLDERGPRLDRLIASDLARQTLVEADPAAARELAPAEPLIVDRYQQPGAGLTLLPYSSEDLRLSSLVALITPDSVDRVALGRYLRAIHAAPKATRERQTIALAGLAGLRDPVLPALQQAAADPKLTIRERLFIGLGAAAIGDAATARSLEQALVEGSVEDLGGQRRLRVGEDKADDAEATALLAILAASVGDRDASEYWAYVEGNPSTRDPLVLQRAAFARAVLARVPTAPAKFAYTVDGKRTEVDLAPGAAFTLVVPKAQQARLQLESLAGKVGVTSTWREAAQPGDFEQDPDIQLERSAQSTVSSRDLVRVDLTVTFGDKALSGCYNVVDFVPSGLRPISELAGWPQDDEDGGRSSFISPYDETPERVSFCADRPKGSNVARLRYYARVVTSGLYTWEPAIARYSSGSARAAMTPAGDVTIE
jgi:hypothetical protein